MPAPLTSTSLVKIVLVWLGCMALRALPWRIPNVEPVMAASLPIAASGGVFAAILFSFLSMVVFDVFSGSVGIWTPVTALTYAGVGVLASVVFKGKRLRPLTAGFFAVYATILYDVITAALGPLAFGQGWVETYVAQVPFTINHVLGNIVLCALFSPLLQRWIAGQSDIDVPRRRHRAQI